jgi:hypothetical protein
MRAMVTPFVLRPQEEFQEEFLGLVLKCRQGSAVFCYAAICPASAERDLSRADWILGLYSQSVRWISATNSPAFRIDLHLYEASTYT